MAPIYINVSPRRTITVYGRPGQKDYSEGDLPQRGAHCIDRY